MEAGAEADAEDGSRKRERGGVCGATGSGSVAEGSSSAHAGCENPCCVAGDLDHSTTSPVGHSVDDLAAWIDLVKTGELDVSAFVERGESALMCSPCQESLDAFMEKHGAHAVNKSPVADPLTSPASTLPSTEASTAPGTPAGTPAVPSAAPAPAPSLKPATAALAAGLPVTTAMFKDEFAYECQMCVLEFSHCGAVIEPPSDAREKSPRKCDLGQPARRKLCGSISKVW